MTTNDEHRADAVKALRLAGAQIPEGKDLEFIWELFARGFVIMPVQETYHWAEMAFHGSPMESTDSKIGSEICRLVELFGGMPSEITEEQSNRWRDYEDTKNDSNGDSYRMMEREIVEASPEWKPEPVSAP